MTIEDTIKERITELIAQAQSLSQGDQHGQVRSESHKQQCKGWLAAALNVVQLIIPDATSAYRTLAEEIATRSSGYRVCGNVGELASLLQNLLKDVEKGLLASLADRARAEVFDDFLDHAKSYLKDGRKNESGVIAGVVFEDSIRRVCRKQNPPIVERDVELDQLISALSTKGVLTATKAKRARAAAGVRTKATHAQWDEFDENDVSATIEFTEEFILNQLEE